MTTTAGIPSTTRPAPDKRVVEVSGSTIAAARAQVAISKRLGRPVSKVVDWRTRSAM